MENEDQTLKDALDTDPDLLDFDLDEESLAETALADAPEDEIIELVDVIKKGKYDPDRFGDTREFRHLFDEDVTAAPKESDTDGIKIKWAEEFEEDEEAKAAPQDSRAATLEIKAADLIYDEEDHSAADVIDIYENDLMSASATENTAASEDDIPVLMEEDLDPTPALIPEVPLDDLMEFNRQDFAEERKEEAISENDLEEVLEGTTTDEISLDFQEESPKPTLAPEPAASTEEQFSLEEELEEALKESDSAKENPEDTAEEEDLEKSLQKLFEDEDEEPLVKTVPSKAKATPAPKAAKAKPLLADQAKAGISKSEIEALISKEVRLAVEKVARETMSNVAEKFIVEAISSLKKSLDSSSD